MRGDQNGVASGAISWRWTHVKPGDLAVIIGNPASLFCHTLAEYWASIGLRVAVVTDGEVRPLDSHDVRYTVHWVPGPRPGAASFLGKLHWDIASRLNGWLNRFERWLWRCERDRKAAALRSWNRDVSAVPPIYHCLRLSDRVRALRPRFVFGQEMFYYGLATAMSRGAARIGMPWGGDIFLSGNSSWLAYRMVRYALNHVDLLCPTSVSSASYMAANYGVPPRKITPISWGADRTLFARAEGDRRREIRRRWRLDPDATLVLNVRRFVPLWGCRIVTDVFLDLARANPGVQCVSLGGEGAGAFVAEARARVQSAGLSERIHLVDGNLPLSDVAELMSVCDVFLSLMQEPDMRSLSIIQATAAGGIPVLSDQPEYREMTKSGFRALLVDGSKPEAVAHAVLGLINDRRLVEQIRMTNDAYIARHEDFQTNMMRLLDSIDAVCAAHAHPPRIATTDNR